MTRDITCREFVEFLDDYLAGSLPEDRRAEFNDHLAQCPPCVAYLSSYRAAIELGRVALARSETPVPAAVPESLVQAVLAARKT